MRKAGLLLLHTSQKQMLFMVPTGEAWQNTRPNPQLPQPFHLSISAHSEHQQTAAIWIDKARRGERHSPCGV